MKARATRLIWILGATWPLLSACATSARFGFPPKVDRLETLKQGESTEADVLLTLGEPQGRGLAQLSARITPRRIWLYELRQIDGASGRQKLLFIFFDGERFDGYLWFSSRELVDVKE